MKVFNMKQIALVFVSLSVFALQAGWPEALTARATTFFHQDVKPIFQKPATYAVLGGAVAVAAAIIYRKDIYWAFRSELPRDRAERRVRSFLNTRISDEGHKTDLINEVLESRNFACDTASDTLIQKKLSTAY